MGVPFTWSTDWSTAGRSGCAPGPAPATTMKRRVPPTMPSGSTNTNRIKQDAEDRRRGGGIAERALAAGRATRRASATMSWIPCCRNTTIHAPSNGPTTVAVPPITTATRNSIESWNVFTLVGVGRVVDEHRARAGDARVQRADGERQHLHLRDVDADGLGRGFVVAHCDQGAAEAAAHEEHHDDHADDGRAERDVVGPLVVAADRRHRRRDPRRRRELGAVERHEVGPARRAQVLRHVTVRRVAGRRPRARA